MLQGPSQCGLYGRVASATPADRCHSGGMTETFPELTGDRVLLRPPQRADVEAVVRLETDPECRRYLGGPAGPEQVAALRASAFTPRRGAYVVTVVGTGEVAGTLFLERQRGELELSYLFLPEFWGRGLALEACTLLLDWAAAEGDDETVIAVTQTANHRSLRLLARLGFHEREQMTEYDAQQSLQSRPLRLPTP